VEKYRWPLLFVGALVSGVVAYVLVGRDNTPGVIVMGLMAVGVIWFHLKDREVDSYWP